MSPTERVERLEAAARGGPAAAAEFDLALSSIRVEPEPAEGWPLHRELAPDGSLIESRFGADDSERLRIYPFGQAFALAGRSGFVHAIDAMGSLVGRQGGSAGARPDRLLSRGFAMDCLLRSVDPAPALAAALAWIDLDSARADLAELGRLPAAGVAAARAGPKRCREAVGVLHAALEAMDLRLEIGAGLASRPGKGLRI